LKGTKESKMSENNAVAVSRRPTRLFVEEQKLIEVTNMVQMGYESRHSSGDEKERDRPQREAVTSSSSIEVLRMPVVDLGKELCSIFPITSEGIGKQGMSSRFNYG
jgi:tyrosine-protein phosphatase SIW14